MIQYEMNVFTNDVIDIFHKREYIYFNINVKSFRLDHIPLEEIEPSH